jgi:hypothetical protein
MEDVAFEELVLLEVERRTMNVYEDEDYVIL